MNLCKTVFMKHSILQIMLFTKSEPIIDPVHGSTCSEKAHLLVLVYRELCMYFFFIFVCVLSVLVFKISMLIPSDEPFGKQPVLFRPRTVSVHLTHAPQHDCVL